MNYKEESIKLHRKMQGKIEMISRVKIRNKDDLSIVYSPGVAEPSLEIFKDNKLSYLYTRKHNTVAVITDGSAVLGLGNIGAQASMPVMEGKAVLFKLLGDVDAIPLCLDTQDTNEIIKTITILSKSFGGINLEDISAPRCFEIENALKKSCDIPIFHDDQHGTAIVVGAALLNALKLAEKKITHVKIVINGAGSAGTAIANFLISIGAQHIIVCDKFGILSKSDPTLSKAHRILSEKTNQEQLTGKLGVAMKDADVFIGVSVAGCVSKDMISSMNHKSIVFAMANPIPEILPEDAYDAGAYIVGTGSSKYSNQINNVLAFPGIFRGALDAHAKEITYDMMKAASLAIANSIQQKDLRTDYIIPDPLDKQVHQSIAKAVHDSALITKVEKTH
ncbi:NAD(P)-dependent malic enzyme [Peloplasma aerotolerans]|uniref:NADP-dependent malic enzyme n=1 Tax=Peloplasma aerotolerans TaxID=3044389 RepID=A0AAW6UA98_9MOLU|nr:NADP-dependent malic enzyme [Mariniplasma sp. M4Ah]MDI6453357.1 NADP-dependent malic enzyme [Mariniplasma sp. M4Ah]